MTQAVQLRRRTERSSMRPSASTPNLSAAGGSAGRRLVRIIVEVGGKPFLDFLQEHPFAQVIVQQLAAIDLADGEIFRLRMPKEQPADAAGRPHGAAFSKFDPGVLLHVEQLP